MRTLLALLLALLALGCPSPTEECSRLDLCCTALFEVDPFVCQQRREGLRATEAQCLRGREEILLLFPQAPEDCR